MSDEVERTIRRRLSELERERRRLERALEALAGSAAPRRPSAPASGGRSRRRVRSGDRHRQFVASVRTNPDHRLADHARAIGVAPQYLANLARKLVATGEIEKVGRGRYRVPAAKG